MVRIKNIIEKICYQNFKKMNTFLEFKYIKRDVENNIIKPENNIIKPFKIALILTVQKHKIIIDVEVLIFLIYF